MKPSCEQALAPAARAFWRDDWQGRVLAFAGRRDVAPGLQALVQGMRGSAPLRAVPDASPGLPGPGSYMALQAVEYFSPS
jgi:hypothetical protein